MQITKYPLHITKVNQVQIIACITQRKTDSCRLLQRCNKNNNETEHKALIDIRPDELRNTETSVISSNI